jgi:hypothetical protein
MIYLFNLVLTSSAAFSLYIWLSAGVINPLVFVLLGWAPPVFAYYLTKFVDFQRMFVLNQVYEAFIVDHRGWIWDGELFVESTHFPVIFYNNMQLEREINKIISITGQRDLYVRIVPPRNQNEEEI